MTWVHKILCVRVQLFGRVQIFAILLSIACQAPLSTEFSKQEYWSGLPFPTPLRVSNEGLNFPAFPKQGQQAEND